MPTTTTVWNRGLSESEIQAFYATQTLLDTKRIELLGNSDDNIIDLVQDDAANTLTITRDWPDATTAQTWTDFVKASHPAVASSVVNP
jgi:hypothetical protein